ncbi:FliH/SctL family protein [Zavarzinia compransoris]|uniref:Uncharacterized protein n=1 Tax=Zavarzinia compransoris TaxID=1264899 RepID=A0A317E9L9_9PROT|nr:FliH/SctL family protein [Zavarzinia compransoris]PWR21825.1 hypothetical protein DKG75_07500 [Zavarzinia compransoris]TDP45375.1 flagellar assembly protein FliH [Zavarzinia compransoris]
MNRDPVKFTFDTDFNPNPARPKKTAAPPPPTFSLDDLNAARAAAHAEGMAAGRAEQAADNDARLAEAEERLGAALSALRDQLAASEARLRADAASLGHAVARRLCEALTARLPLAEMDAMVADCLTDLKDEPRVVIHVADSLLDEARARFLAQAEARAFPGQVVVLGDAQLAPGDVNIEWTNGGILRDGAALAEAVASAVDRYVTAQQR